MLAYLCGPIEFAPDQGKLWRRKIRPFLEEELRHSVYDPAADQKKDLTEEEMSCFRAWKETDVERYRRAVRKIINYDLDIIENKADYLICFWDNTAMQSAGTAAEMTAAYRKGIPVYLVSEQPPSGISGWMLACADRVFRSLDELKCYFQEIYGRQTTLWDR
jgi:nucleoside 2-deoxyribosyltransferase